MIELVPGAHLTSDLIDLIAKVTASLGDVSVVLVQQARAATVISASPTMIDVKVPHEFPAVGIGNGPTPGRAMVYSGADVVGEVLVWVRAGRLQGIKRAWYTDQPPSGWPMKERVRVE